MDPVIGIRGKERTDAMLEAAAANLRARREAGAEQLRIGYDWAYTHRRTAREHLGEEAGAAARAGRDVKRIGASAFPVGEYASAELAVAWQIHPLAAQQVMGDAVDLKFRLPHTWAAVQQLRLDAWVARKICTKTRDLDFEKAQWVDEQVADKLGALPPGRLLTYVEGRVVAADRKTAEEKWAQAAAEHTVHAGRESEHGTRTLFARMDAAALMRLMATITLIAKLLPPVEGETPGETQGETPGETPGQRHARALALLADPQAALDLLAGRDPRGGRAVVYVHTTPQQLATGEGVARAEDLGPMTLTMLTALLGHAQITLKPVIDLNDTPAADSYEIPTSIAERVHLTQPADAFPYAEGTSRRTDLDHTRPYDDTGPPGQTTPGNLGKLNRRHHRIKTHAPGWTVERLPGNRYLWTTPHGRHLIVDRHGTEPLGDTLRRVKHRLDVIAA